MLRLNCFITVSQENREEVLSAAKRLTEASLKQDGIIRNRSGQDAFSRRNETGYIPVLMQISI